MVIRGPDSLGLRFQAGTAVGFWDSLSALAAAPGAPEKIKIVPLKGLFLPFAGKEFPPAAKLLNIRIRDGIFISFFLLGVVADPLIGILGET